MLNLIFIFQLQLLQLQIVIMIPMDRYLEKHNTRSQSQKTDHADNQGNIILTGKLMGIMISKMKDCDDIKHDDNC